MTNIKLCKRSLPNVWEMEFPTVHDAAIELRKHICKLCLEGTEDLNDKPPLDFVFEGRKYECTDITDLLQTACGLEFELEGDHGLYPQQEDMEIGVHNRISRRKTAPVPSNEVEDYLAS